MRSMRIDVLCHLVAAIFAVLPTLGCAEGDDKVYLKKCNVYDLDKAHCDKNQRCRLARHGEQAWCECLRGFHIVNDECVSNESTTMDVDPITPMSNNKSESGGSSVAAGLLIPTFVIATGVLLYLGARRYKWLQRFRQYRNNRYGNVLVTRDDDDDDDDPPIA